MKIFSILVVWGISLCCLAQTGLNSNGIVPIINYVLQEDETKPQTRLERVLEAYQTPNSSHVFIAAHRGGKEDDVADAAPGNSIVNIDNALSKDFDLYESDIEILGDGTLIVFHDDDFTNLTNFNTLPQAQQDANLTLNDSDWAFAQTLFLTYDNGTVSTERIPLLEEFLSAIKGKMMVKFDLKSDTFGTNTIGRIIQAAIDTETTEQVLIRAGRGAADRIKAAGYDTKIMMPRFDSEPTITDINSLVAELDVRAISIPNGASDAVITAAVNAGLIIEVHELNDDIEADWQTAINQGVRQFHAFKPSLVKAFLESNNYREF